MYGFLLISNSFNLLINLIAMSNIIYYTSNKSKNPAYIYLIEKRKEEETNDDKLLIVRLYIYNDII